MSKSIKKNYVYNLAYQVLALLVPLVTMPYVSRVLGADGVGVYSFAESVVSYFVLFAVLGTTTYGQREISYVQENRAKRSEAFWNIAILRLVSALLALTVYSVFILMWNPEYQILYWVLSLNVINVIVDMTWYLQGMEEFRNVAIRNSAVKVASAAFIFICVKQHDDLIIYAVGLIAAIIIGNISVWRTIGKQINPPRMRSLHPFKDMKTVISLFVPTIAISIYTVLDKTMIGVMTASAIENGYYEQAMKISRIVLMVVTSLGTVMIPRIGSLFAQGKEAEVKSYMYRSYRFVWFAGIPLCFGLIGVGSNFVPWFFGDGFDGVVPILSVLSFLLLAIGVNNVTGMQYLIPTKRQNAFTATVLVGAISNFVLNLMLIPFFQAVGAAIASVAAESIIAVLQLAIVRKELAPSMIIASSVKYLISGLAMLAILLIATRYLSPSILNTLILTVSGGLVYVLALCLLRDEFFLGLVSQLRNKISHG